MALSVFGPRTNVSRIRSPWIQLHAIVGTRGSVSKVIWFRVNGIQRTMHAKIIQFRLPALRTLLFPQRFAPPSRIAFTMTKLTHATKCLTTGPIRFQAALGLD